MHNVKLVIGMLGIACIVIFSIQNAELLTVNFLFWSFELRRAIMLFLVLFIGVAIGWTLHGWPRRPSSDQRHSSTKQ